MERSQSASNQKRYLLDGSPAWVTNTVNSRYTFPFQPFDASMSLSEENQLEAIERLGPLDKNGWFAETGTGKTVMTTYVACYKLIEDPSRLVVVLAPPVLIPQWVHWLRSIKGINNVVDYRGSKAHRQSLDIKSAEFVVMSIQVFKLDYDHLANKTKGRSLVGIIDEAQAVKNAYSANHKWVDRFFSGHSLMLATGTPIDSPNDTYAYIKLLSIGAYSSKEQFDRIHVKATEFGRPTEWQHLDLMRQSLMSVSCRLLKDEVFPDRHKPIIQQVLYELSPKHKALYRELMTEKLLLLEDGGKIDATAKNALYIYAQQIVTNPREFGADFDPALFDIYDELIQEIGTERDPTRKVLSYANFRMTNKTLAERYSKLNAVAVYSDVSRSKQDANVKRFLEDPTCLFMQAHFKSGGVGLNPHHVCADEIFAELPMVPSDFWQAVGRTDRIGQQRQPHVRVAVALGTIQERLWESLQHKDALANEVQISAKDLRDAILP